MQGSQSKLHPGSAGGAEASGPLIGRTPGGWNAATLLISDPNLGGWAEALLRRHCRDLTALCWDRSKEATRKEALAVVATRRWDLCISFYSDLIIPPDLLDRIDLALNIHPALPAVRGTGYDAIPLVDAHPSHGTTLHRMVEEIDAGQIFHVIERPLEAATATELRRTNQVLCARHLRMLCDWMLRCGTPQALEAQLQKLAAGQSRQWGDAYLSRRDLDDLLATLRCLDPDHSVFR
ncbi:MAG: hypothetical protein HKN82_20075 [Akkermansiaceae bacterium]|nr:hypothetical protein [Akkermansiaceae bacterium]NNM28010.1 hypothetical protein [Akkermansiaceae bacterium]